MEADLWSASWRARKARGIIQSRSKGTGIWGQKEGVTAQAEALFALPLLSVLFLPSGPDDAL